MKKLFVGLLIFLAAFNITSQIKILYVSTEGNDSNSGTLSQPYKTMQKALDASVHKEIDSILIKKGYYHLEKPLIIKPEYSGKKKGLVISNYMNEQVIINGGKDIAGWKIQENGWWITEIPEVKEGNWKFRQLYVNGKLRQRAKKPNNGFLRVAGMPEGTPKSVGYYTACQSFEFAEGDFKDNWRNMKDIDVIVYHFWTDSHLPIESVDMERNLVTFKYKSGKVFTDDFSETGARYIIENVFEELDVPGEWYLDHKTGKCYYFPFPDEIISETQFIAPITEQLIYFKGDPITQNLIKNISFNNLEFCYTHFELPEGNSNDKQGSASVSAAISLTGVQNCSFSHCRFTNLGNWAFEINEGCSENTFLRNEIGNVAAGGFRVNGGNYNEHPFLRTFKNQIIQNHIHHFGEIYPSAVGILLQHTEGNLVSNNLIHHGYYTGISVGWDWGYHRSISRDNIIEYNHIHHIGQGLLSDMGAIYTLGVSPGTIIRNNLIHDVDANHYGGWGIYNDEGSTHILIENNIVYNTKFAPYNIHFAKEVTVRNNIFGLGRLQQLNRTRSEPHKSVYFEQNIVYWQEGILHDGIWTDEPYQFYFHPKNEKGKRQVNETFDMDYNLYFNPEKLLSEIIFGNGNTWEEWQKKGKDIHSVYADPLFKDINNFDFNLNDNSPAFKLGFLPIDIKRIGLQNKVVGPLYCH